MNAVSDNLYEEVEMESKEKIGSKPATGLVVNTNGSSQGSIVVLFVLVIALLLATVCACIAFAVEISKCKHETGSLQKALSLLQQTQYDFVNGSIENLTQQVGSVEYHSQQLTSSQSELTSSDVQLDRSQPELASSVQQLNSSLNAQITSLNDEVQQLHISIGMVNSSLGSGQHAGVSVSSCAALPPSSPSGYYWVSASNGSAVRVYCDMTRSCGGVTGGWVRVAELDMTNSSHQCPSGLAPRPDPQIRTCVRSDATAGCTSLNDLFTQPNIQYSRVCGRVIGYQYSSTDAVHRDADINSAYVDGISITRGNPRNHIWTFITAIEEVDGTYPRLTCPCSRVSGATLPPPFVGNDYFCETGNAAEQYEFGIFYRDDPLWDGAGCRRPQNTCCSFNNPPWFYKQLPRPTTDNIEMRVCRDETAANEDVAIQIIDIYIQ